MLKIRTMNKIAPSGLSLFDPDRYQISDDIEEPDAILVRSTNLLEMDFPPSLKAIARAGAGVNNIPVSRCSENGVVVFNTPGANANAVKELAIAALLLVSRDVISGINWVRALPHGTDIAKAVEKGKSRFSGPELKGKTLGVFGLGAVGTMVANAASSLGMEVYGNDPYITVDSAWRLSRNVKRAADPTEIFSRCDYIALHVPSTPETKGFINAETLASMKDGVRIINLSRGDLVNDAAMGQALESGKVACYLSDFPTEEVLQMKNVIAVPHLGASTPESEANCAAMAVSELIEYLEGGNIQNSVNFPDVANPRGGDESLCIIHKNVPTMLAQLSARLSDAGLNIENLSSRSKKDYAYSVFEITGQASDALIRSLYDIDGIIRVNEIKNHRSR